MHQGVKRPDARNGLGRAQLVAQALDEEDEIERVEAHALEGGGRGGGGAREALDGRADEADHLEVLLLLLLLLLLRAAAGGGGGGGVRGRRGATGGGAAAAPGSTGEPQRGWDGGGKRANGGLRLRGGRWEGGGREGGGVGQALAIHLDCYTPVSKRGRGKGLIDVHVYCERRQDSPSRWG